MTYLVLCATVAVVSGVQAANAPRTPWVTVQDERGRPVASFVVADEPFKAGMLPRVGESRVVKDKQGRQIGGFGYYAWAIGASVRVIVLAEVPAADARQDSYPSDNERTRLEPFASYLLALGESRRIDEMKALGLGPRTVSVQLPGK